MTINSVQIKLLETNVEKKKSENEVICIYETHHMGRMRHKVNFLNGV